MGRARVAALTAIFLMAAGACPGTASAAQPSLRAAGSPVPASPVPTPSVPSDSTRIDRDRPERQVMQRGPRSPFFMREVLPDGPRAVPMPELLRSGPRPVPMPRTGPEAPFDGTLGGELRAPRRPQGTKPGGTEAIPKELEDAVETLVP